MRYHSLGDVPAKRHAQTRRDGARGKPWAHAAIGDLLTGRVLVRDRPDREDPGGAGARRIGEQSEDFVVAVVAARAVISASSTCAAFAFANWRCRDKSQAS